MGKGQIISSGVAVNPAPPSAPGVFTISALSYEWLTHEVLGNKGKRATAAGLLRVFIPVTPPGSMGTTKGAHIYLEMPDISSSTTGRMDGVTDMSGSFVMQDNWAPVDEGKLAYVASEQPWYVDLDVEITDTTIIRIYAPSYSDDIDTPLVQAGKAGASPSALLTVNPFVPGKSASGSNRTTLLVTGITVVPGATQLHDAKLYRPISVTVDLTGLPAVRPTNWRYQLIGFRDDDLTSSPVLVSGLYTLDGLAGAGQDAITAPHTFGPDEPTEVISVTIYAVAGVVGSPRADVISADSRSQQPVWFPNNLIKGITASATITYGTVTGVTDPTQHIQALLDTSVGVNNAVFGVLPLGIDNARIALLAVDTAQLAALAATAAKLATGAVTTAKIAALNVDTAALAASAVTTAKVASANITTALIAGANITTALIANAAITSALIGSAAVGTAAIANAAITTALIANAAITNALIASLAVGTANIQNLAVTAALIANATITGAKIASATITNANIAAATITSAEIANATITAAKIVSLDVAQLTGTSASFSGDVTFARSSSNSAITISSTGLNLKTGSIAGVTISTAGAAVFTESLGTSTTINGNAITTGTLSVVQYVGTGGSFIVPFVISCGTFSSATAGANTLPSNPEGFFEITINGATKKIPYYGV